MVQIKIGDQILYNHPEKKNDMRAAIQLLADASISQKNATSIQFTANLDERKICIADIAIHKIHTQKKHTVEIKFTGELEEERFHRFLNYLREHLSVDFKEEKIKE